MYILRSKIATVVCIFIIFAKNNVAYAFESQSDPSRCFVDIIGWIACTRHDISETVCRF